MQNVVGRKPIASTLLGIAVNIAVDIWWLVSFGLDAVFGFFVGITAVQVFYAIFIMSKSINVKNHAVVINGNEIPYNHIHDVKTTKGILAAKGVTVKTADGKKHRVPVNNNTEVSTAIIANKANAQAAPTI